MSQKRKPGTPRTVDDVCRILGTLMKGVGDDERVDIVLAHRWFRDGKPETEVRKFFCKRTTDEYANYIIEKAKEHVGQA